jgi:hypothetical protein
MAQHEDLDNASHSLTFDIDIRMGAMENNYEELVKVIEDMKFNNVKGWSLKWLTKLGFAKKKLLLQVYLVAC